MMEQDIVIIPHSSLQLTVGPRQPLPGQEQGEPASEYLADELADGDDDNQASVHLRYRVSGLPVSLNSNTRD